MDNLQKLDKILRDAEKEILAELAGADLVTLTKKRKSLERIREVLIQLNDPINQVIVNGINSEFELSTKSTDKQLANVTATFSATDFAKASLLLDTAESIIEDTTLQTQAILSNTYAQLERDISSLSKKYKAIYFEKLALGQMKGDAKAKITADIVDSLKKKGLTGIVTEAGDQMNMSKYIDSIVRSGLTKSSAMGVVERALQNGQDLVKVDTHRNPSHMCSHWQGKILSITGLTKGYPTLQEATFNGDYKKGGLFHKYCRHSLVVYVPTSVEFVN